MVEVGTKFSLINKSTYLTVAIFLAVWLVCFVTTIWVVMNFSEVFSSIRMEGFNFDRLAAQSIHLYTLVVLSFPFLTVSLLTLPVQYVTVAGGIRSDSIVRSRTVSFESVDRVRLDVVGFPRLFRSSVKIERMFLVVKEHGTVFVSLALNYVELRDHVLESVDSSIVVDDREESKVG